MRKVTPAVLTAVALAVLPASAGAAFPGKNGRIAFNHDRQIVTVKSDGSDRRRLTHGPGFKTNASFSPSGRRVVFAKEMSGGNHDLFVVNAKGRDQTRLSRTRHRDENTPSFSPNGKRIVFARRPDPRRATGAFDIYVMRANGSAVRSLTHTSESETHPSFSPIGGPIAFERLTEEGDSSIGLMDRDGTNERRLTAGEAPSFSPNGDRIAFKDSGIWRIDVNGENRVQLTSGLDILPAYSPNGKRVAFSRFLRNNSSGGSIFALLSVTEDGTDERRLTKPGLRPDWGPRPK